MEISSRKRKSNQIKRNQKKIDLSKKIKRNQKKKGSFKVNQTQSEKNRSFKENQTQSEKNGSFKVPLPAMTLPLCSLNLNHFPGKFIQSGIKSEVEEGTHCISKT
eukprot:804905_1